MTHIKSLFLNAISSVILLTACGNKGADSPPPKVEKAPISSNSAPKSPEKPIESSPPAQVIADRGQTLYKRCRTCHTLEQDGRHKVGPNLYEVFGATAGTKEGFNYSTTMKESAIVWTDENLTGYIENPSKFMPGNRMSFVGIRKPDDIQELLNYMRKEMSSE